MPPKKKPAKSSPKKSADKSDKKSASPEKKSTSPTKADAEKKSAKSEKKSDKVSTEKEKPVDKVDEKPDKIEKEDEPMPAADEDTAVPEVQVDKKEKVPKKRDPLFDNALTELHLEDCKFPLRTIVETFLKHPDSSENDISESITLKFSGNGPSTFRIHETFPILTLQDESHFCSFGLDRALYETLREEQLKPSGDLKFVDLAQYQLTIKKIRIQIRRVNSREIYSSYCGMEVRLILLDAELCKQQSAEDIMSRRKNWMMKSVYRDADVRSLMQSKYHQRMGTWLDSAVAEFEDYPKSWTPQGEEIGKFDRGGSVIVQPELDEKDASKAKLKAEVGKEMYFECIAENYDKVPGQSSQDTQLTPMDCEDLSILERGRAKYEEMLQNRRSAEELRKLRDSGFEAVQMVNARFNTEEERRRTQERQMMRQSRNEAKEGAEQARTAHFQLTTLQKHFGAPPDDVTEEKRTEVQLMSRRGNAPVPPRLHLNHAKRFVLWFREFVLKDSSVHQNQIEKNKDENLEPKVDKEREAAFYKEHNFSVTLAQRIKRPSELIKVKDINNKRQGVPEKLVPKDPKKFTLQAKPRDNDETKAEDGDEKKPVVGVKRAASTALGGLAGKKGGLGNSLKKQAT